MVGPIGFQKFRRDDLRIDMNYHMGALACHGDVLARLADETTGEATR